MMNKKLLGNILLLLTAMIWGTAFVAQRVGMESIEPVTFTAARMYLAAAAVGMVALLIRSRETRSGKKRPPEEVKKRRKNAIIGGICCGTFLVLATIFQQMGIVYTPAGKAGFITALYILLVPVIQFVLFKKKNSWIVWLAVLIGLFGMYLLCMNGGFSIKRGDTLIWICAILFSGHILSCDYFSGLGNPIDISAIQFIAASVIATVIAFILEQPSWEKILSAAIPIMYCGLISGGIGYTFQMIAQRYTDPTIASLLMSLESVFAVIAGAILIHERMSMRELAGCVIIFLAVILVQLPSFRGKESMIT